MERAKHDRFLDHYNRLQPTGTIIVITAIDLTVWQFDLGAPYGCRFSCRETRAGGGHFDHLVWCLYPYYGYLYSIHLCIYSMCLVRSQSLRKVFVA